MCSVIYRIEVYTYKVVQKMRYTCTQEILIGGMVVRSLTTCMHAAYMQNSVKAVKA